MNNFIKKHWLKIVIAVAVLIFALSIGYYAGQRSDKPASNLEWQSTCSDMALKFFHYKDYTVKDGYTFTNHYNSKLNKCFIEISGYIINDDFLTIDLYDAVEGKHYAEFDGHNMCDPIALSLNVPYNPKKCQLDSGNVWLDGNDQKTADYHVGFGGLLNGGIGDENTQKQFLEHINPFMEN